MPPILNFHGLGTVRRRLDPGEDRVWLGTDAFTAVLDSIRGRPDVRLTFDDGNRSDLDIALPELVRRGLSATFFVCTGRIGRPDFLDASAIRSLRDAGMAVGSHGHEHVPWRSLAGEAARREWAEPKRILEDLLGAPVTEAACPFGSYGRKTLAGLRAAGFATVLTSDRQWAEGQSFLQPRYTLRDGDGPSEVARWLERPKLPDRWLGKAKMILKSLR